MQRIAVDMDGVLADVYPKFFYYDEMENGRRKTIEEVTGKAELDAFEGIRKYVTSPGFFRDLSPVPDSQDVLKKLHDRYEVFIVSAATEFPLSLGEKHDWLNEHFPFISWKQMIFCGVKSIVDADIMIDDHFKHLDAFKNSTILFSQPHNLLRNAGRHKRVHTWLEIADILL